MAGATESIYKLFGIDPTKFAIGKGGRIVEAPSTLRISSKERRHLGNGRYKLSSDPNLSKGHGGRASEGNGHNGSRMTS